MSPNFRPPLPMQLMRGTLDVLILKTLSWSPLHGYAISRAIRATSGEDLNVEEGALYPALRRLEARGLLESTWGLTDTGRQARFYQLTDDGLQQLERGVREWQRYVDAMSRVLLAEAPA